MQRYPIAYLRRSSADAGDPGDVSREQQEGAVRDLAKREGHNGDLRILADWDRSADETKEGRRTGFLTMLAAVERGEVSAIYAASLDRLYRSLRTFVRLTDAATKEGVRIVTAREGVLGGDGSPMAMAFAEITAVFSTLELRTTKARAAGALAVRRQRGDHIGRVGYGYKLARDEAGAIVAVPDPSRPLEPVLAAVRDAGSILGACKLLNERKVPVPQGPSRERRHGQPIWHPTPLRKIVARNAPELLPPTGPTGRRQPSRSSVLAQLLVCHCRDAEDPGRRFVLTPEPARKGYRCTRGNRIGRDAHGPMWVAERTLLPWIMAEAARFRPPADRFAFEVENANALAALDGERERWKMLFVKGHIDAAETDRAIGDIDERRAALASTAEVVTLGPIDWTKPDQILNNALRAMFIRIELGPDLRPVNALWAVPEWRGA